MDFTSRKKSGLNKACQPGISSSENFFPIENGLKFKGDCDIFP